MKRSVRPIDLLLVVLATCALVLRSSIAVGAAPTENLWLLAVGVSRYGDPTINLEFADRDATSLAQAVQRLQGSMFAQVHAKVLVNEEASRSSILQAMREFGQQAGPNDAAVIVLAGHGVVEGGSYYFLPHSANATNLTTEGLSLTDFGEAMSTISGKVARVVLLVDTCHAGALEIGVRGISVHDGGGGAPRATGAVREHGISLAEPLAPKLREAYVLSASTERESSLEDPHYRLPGERTGGHGAFTYALLRGMRGEADVDRDGKVSVLELFRYTTTQVPKITGGRQHPWVDARGTDFTLAAVASPSPESVKNGKSLLQEARAQQGQGKLEDALKTYERAEQANPRDEAAAILHDNANDDLLFQRDPQRQAGIATQARKLVDEYRRQSDRAPDDPWSPRPTVITFLGFETLGTGKDGSGLHEVLAQRVAQSLAGTKRVQVVERRLIEKILDEMKLSMSDLSDSGSRLKIGKILVARLIASGTVISLNPSSLSVDLRLIDTETSEIAFNVSKRATDPEQILAIADDLSAEIASQLQRDYPIRGKVISVTGDELVLNIGSKHGVTPGLQMKAVTEEPVKVGDAIVATRKKEIGTLEIQSVEDAAAFAHLADKSGPIAKGTKVIEALPARVPREPARGS